MLKWKRIADNFISISVGKEYDAEPYYWTTLYYYKGLVIDTGCPLTAEESADFIEKSKLDVKAILLTHYHEDHSGGAYLLKERLDVDILAPKKSLEILGNPPEIPEYRQIVWGQPKPIKATPLQRKIEFNKVTVTTVETPGHSFDHVSFLIENIMFTGDLVTNPTPVIIMKEEDSIDAMDSLRVIVDLDFEKSYGGHGVWDKNGIKETLTNMLKIKERVDVLWSMGLDVEQIVEEIFPNVPKKVLLMEEMSGGEWSRKNLVESILGMRHKPPSSLPPKSNVN
jgi:glyoxylase-like metal-dependent hydrolase (beta-lactamase superfamily II)